MGINVGPAPLIRVREIVTVYEGDVQRIEVTRYELEETPPITGPTTRLAVTCRACGDTLPQGAVFCIECGEKQG